MTKLPKAIAMARISSVTSEGNSSLPGQEAEIRRWAAGRYDLVDVVPMVESATCSVANRPEFLKILQRMDDENIEALIVYHMDRFFRNTEEGLRVARVEFVEKERSLISICQSIDLNDDDGWYMMTMYLAFAEREARTIKRRFRNGRDAKRDAGGYIGGEAPYGWQSNGTGQLIENAEEQKIRNDILRWSAEGLSQNGIARRLNDHGKLTRKGCQWSHKTIGSITKRLQAVG